MVELARHKGSQSMELAALIALGTALSLPTPLHDAEKARSFSEAALLLARQQNDRAAEARILWNYLLSYMYSGHMDEGIPYGEQSAELARALGLQEQLAYSLQDLSLAYMSIGELEKMRRALEEARPVCEALENLPMLAENWNNTALERLAAGAFEDAVAFYDKGFEIARRIGNLWGQVNNRVFISQAYMARGEMDRALEIQNTFFPLARTVSHPGSSLILLQKAWAFAYLGENDKAKQLAEKVVPEAAIFPPFHAYALTIFARYLIKEGNLSEAENLLRTRKEIQEHNKTIFELEVVMALIDIEFALASGKLEASLLQMNALLDLLDRSGARYFLPEAYYLKANILLVQDQRDAALRVLLDARDAAQEIGFRTQLWRILALLARVAEARGDRESARRYRKEALPVIEFIAAHTNDAELRESFIRFVESAGIQLDTINPTRSIT
jgi:tetratricopeptide (TPR) repeat protein